MKPILYSKNGTKIGVLDDTMSALVTEQRNGVYTANFTYSCNGKYFSQIEYDSIVMLKPNQKSKLQQFRVSNISKSINGVVSYGCEHISYELNKNPIMVVGFPTGEGVEGTPGNIINTVLRSTMINNFYYGCSDITTVKKCVLDFMSARDAILKTQQYFGGELEWDNYDVILHKERGVDNGSVISYGVNLLDYTNKLDVSNVYTAISPYMQTVDNDGHKVTYYLPEKILTYYNAQNYSYIRARAVDFSNEFTEEELETLTSEAQIIDELRSKAIMYMLNNDPADISHNVTLSYVDLRKAKEFAAIETMNDLGLCDYVTLKDKRLGVNFKGKVITTKFNVLTEMYDSIEIGNPAQQLLDALASIVSFVGGNTISETVDEIEKNLDEYFSEIKVTDNRIIFKSGNIKNREGVYNTYTYKIERDTDIQEEGVKGKIISFTDPKNRKTKIKRE